MTGHPRTKTSAYSAANRAQKEASDPARSVWVDANAGSGKTRVLIDRVARLLLPRRDGQPGVRPDSILCVTYTKAAANEMLSRLYTYLGSWSVAPDPDLREALAALEERPATSYTDAELRKARTLFARALETPGGLRIETIHAFCGRVLRRFPLEAGIPPGFREIEEDESDALWAEVVAEGLVHAAEEEPEALETIALLMKGRGASEALEDIKKKRRELLAFAADLKTSGDRLEARIMMAAKAPPESSEVLISKAMNDALPRPRLEMALEGLRAMKAPQKTDIKLITALETVLGSGPESDRYSTYMSAVAGAQHTFPGGTNPFTKKAPQICIDLFQRNMSQTDRTEGLEITRLKRLKQSLAARETAERTIALMQLGLSMVERYHARKAAINALDFDDLIEKTRALLSERDVSDWVLYKLDGGLTHLLLDEAQDTSPQQWQVLNALTRDFQSGEGRTFSGGPRTRFIVGDPKQSIYSFQGADQRVFKQEHLSFVSSEEQIGQTPVLPHMEMSFRSVPEILSMVDAVMQTVPINGAATDFLPDPDANIARHTAFRHDDAGRVEFWPLEEKGEEAEEVPWTAPPDYRPAENAQRKLAERIANYVKTQIDGTHLKSLAGKETGDTLRPEDFLILVRSRTDMFRFLIDSLQQQGVPVAGADRLHLLSPLGVQDCLNLIRFALQPGDDLVLAEILRGPFCGLVHDDSPARDPLFALAYNRPPGQSLWDRLEASTDPVFQKAKAFCTHLISHQHLSAFSFLSHYLNRRGEDGLSGLDRLIARLGEATRDPLLSLIQRALAFDSQNAASLTEFLAQLEKEGGALKRELSEASDSVRIMTVHGAKGLQAPIVILPDTSKAQERKPPRLFITESGTPLYTPNAALACEVTEGLRQKAKDDMERESRRLLYVAMTRAESQLIICGVKDKRQKQGYGKNSWYRWCLTGMRHLKGLPLELDWENTGSPPGEKLVYGADLPRLEPSQAIAPETKHITPRAPEMPSWLKRAAPPSAPPLRLAAPSRLMDTDEKAARPFSEVRRAGLKRGRLIHTLLEHLPDIAEQKRREAATAFLGRAEALNDAEQAEIFTTVFKVLDTPEYADFFNPKGRSEAAIIGTLPDGRVINGRVDRLIVSEAQILIIDYKSDRPAPASAGQIGTAYKTQMAAYASVMQKLYPDKAVKTALLYTDGPRLYLL